VFASALSENHALLADVRTRVNDGLVTWAECGGFLWLCESLAGTSMAGVVPATARMTDRLTLGYRRATPTVDCPLAPLGTELRGHEFHYSTVEPSGDALTLEGRFGQGRGGYASTRLLASYLHLHLAGAPGAAERFVAVATRRPAA
jgi:cobyrinic acid a,c-diamide synthase